MPSKRKVLIIYLPYSVNARDRKVRFPIEMEFATTLCNVESGRDKGGGLLFKHEPEEIAFITKMCYPLWLVPWEGNENLLFDGFGLYKHTITYYKTPSVSMFLTDLNTIMDKLELFSNALKRHKDTFKTFVGEKQHEFEGLIAHSGLIFDFLQYLKTRPARKKEKTAPLKPRIARERVISSVKSVTELKETIKKDIADLEQATATLNELTRIHIRNLQTEIAGIEQEYKKRIDAVRPLVERDVKDLESRCAEEMKIATQRFEDQKKMYVEQLSAFEKEAQTLQNDIVTYKQRLQTARETRDAYSEQLWGREIENAERRLGALRDEFARVRRGIEGIGSDELVEVQRIKGHYERLIDDKWRRVRKLEGERDAQISTINVKIRGLQNKVFEISEKIRGLIGSKEESINRLEGLKILKEIQGKISLLYVPFYVVKYERGKKIRYDIYPPALAISRGFSKTLLIKLGKFILPIECRSEAIEEMLADKFQKLIETDHILEREVSSIGRENNLLKIANAKAIFTKGLNRLQREGWLSEKNVEGLKDVYNYCFE